MNPKLKAGIEGYARTLKLKGVDPSFYERLNQYMARLQKDGERVLGRKLSPEQHRIVEGYITHHALHIAIVDEKTVAQADDVKAAIWFFHLHLTDCPKAALAILKMEDDPARRRILSEAFRSHIEKELV